MRLFKFIVHKFYSYISTHTHSHTHAYPYFIFRVLCKVWCHFGAFFIHHPRPVGARSVYSINCAKSSVIILCEFHNIFILLCNRANANNWKKRESEKKTSHRCDGATCSIMNYWKNRIFYFVIYFLLLNNNTKLLWLHNLFEREREKQFRIMES